MWFYIVHIRDEEQEHDIIFIFFIIEHYFTENTESYAVNCDSALYVKLVHTRLNDYV